MLLKKTRAVEECSSEILSKPEFQRPTGKNKGSKKFDIDEEYAALGWEEAQK